MSRPNSLHYCSQLSAKILDSILEATLCHSILRSPVSRLLVVAFCYGSSLSRLSR
jgi:hypothetical protein